MTRAWLAVPLGLALGCAERGEGRDAGAGPSASVSSRASASAAPAKTDAPSAVAVPAVPPLAASAAVAKLGGACKAGKDAAIAFSPEAPAPGKPLRVMVTTETEGGRLGVVFVEAGEAPVLATAEERLGPPRSAFASIATPRAGKTQIIAVRGDDVVGCREVDVAEPSGTDRRAHGSRPWRVVRGWDESTEDLYSAWIEKLFDVKETESLSVPALHELTRDPNRNFLFDHLGLGEDAPSPEGLRLDPDCADLPYTLRAYFAFKLGLPFAFSSCSRGTRQNAPKCLKRLTSNDKMDEASPDRVRRMDRFLRVRLADTVHSGTGRTRGEDDFTDYYPIRLSRETLRPGAIFADPYGHILVVARRVPQTAERAGALFAVDGQPDGTVAKKRFWQGNFLFSTAEPAMGTPGFKRFRPVKLAGNDVVSQGNGSIAVDPAYGDIDQAQATMDTRAFYDAMDDVLSPEPLDPDRALAEAVRALHEQAEARVNSVENGEKYFREGGAKIDMPDGGAIFETTGEWEDFSTPSRDLRLLIAIDVVTGFPALVGRRPERFKMPPGTPKEDVVTGLEAELGRRLKEAKLSYPRSDGTKHEVSLADLAARKGRLEMAYNPNDCPEVRWGAPEKSDEIATCRRRAGGDQRAKMEKSRAWFRERKRPPRGG